nr:MAG TPA: hypothetical protein [Caudoviricetes sp.]
MLTGSFYMGRFYQIMGSIPMLSIFCSINPEGLEPTC